MDNTGFYRCCTLDKVTKRATVPMNIHDQSLCHCCVILWNIQHGSNKLPNLAIIVCSFKS